MIDPVNELFWENDYPESIIQRRYFDLFLNQILRVAVPSTVMSRPESILIRKN